MSDIHRISLLDSAVPPFESSEHAESLWNQLVHAAEQKGIKDFYTSLSQDASKKKLIDFIFTSSPYLTQLIIKHPLFLKSLLSEQLSDVVQQWEYELSFAVEQSQEEVMRLLRRHKSKGALLIALADVSECWALEEVTASLSGLAERCVDRAARYLLAQLQRRGELASNSLDDNGIIILGMGKLGGRELNYSSDIDLILLYEPEKLTYSGRHSLQHCLNKFAQDLCRLMQDRTADGYVFRTDLRLRPDPSSTPLIVSVDSAIRYYESVGQNWERAAFIKARPVGADYSAGEAFLAMLKPFIWRKNLDFGAIADIHSLKRQMDGRDAASIKPAGHNIKTGTGGIREIEFIAQISQLIWGGKQRELRTRPTCHTLRELVAHRLLDKQEAEVLITHYTELRSIEHRLQMMHDHQTHRLPEDDHERAVLATFCGYESLQAFDGKVKGMLVDVHQIYTESFDTTTTLTAGGRRLSFTGVDADRETVKTLEELGFRNPETAIHIIQQWHRGTIRATRSERARQLLTELTPTLLEKFGKAVDPDHAFAHFAGFMAALPAGVQLFSLFYSNPELIDEIVRVTGTAPGLAEQLSKHPEWLEIILAARHDNILTEPPNPAKYVDLSDHADDAIRWLCRYRNEWDFLVGIEVLRHNLTPLDAQSHMSANADAVLRLLLDMTIRNFQEDYGEMPGGSLCVLALGRLGSEELTFGSDLDLVFIYNADDPMAVSTGRRSFPAAVYYNRLCQRLVNHLECMTSEGKLYDIDTRLRPSGKDGMLAVSLEGFSRYYRESAWTFEKMALIKSRVVAGDSGLGNALSEEIKTVLTAHYDSDQLRDDILDIRMRVAREFSPYDHWQVKHARGGLMDITFIAQYFGLRFGNVDNAYLSHKVPDILRVAAAHNSLTNDEFEPLIRGWDLQEQVLCLLRLCQQGFTENFANRGLKDFLLSHTGHETFMSLREELISLQDTIYGIFTHYIGEYLNTDARS